MKTILILLFCLSLCNIDVTAQNKVMAGSSDSIQKLFPYHFKKLDKAAKKNKVDTIYCCMASVDFMERFTKIEPGVMGNYLGRFGFTKVALKQWHEWYDKRISSK